MGHSLKRRTMLSQKKIEKENKMKTPGHKSDYAKKKDYLRKNGGFGFQYPDKPWK